MHYAVKHGLCLQRVLSTSAPSISEVSSELTASTSATSASKILSADETILTRYLNDNAVAIQQELKAKRANQSFKIKERKKARYNVMTSVLKEAWGMDGTNPKLLKLTQPAPDKVVPTPVRSTVNPNSVAYLLETTEARACSTTISLGTEARKRNVCS